MISIPGSLSFAKLVMMSSAPAKSAGDARYASQDPFIHSLIDRLSQTIPYFSVGFWRLVRFDRIPAILVCKGERNLGRVPKLPRGALVRVRLDTLPRLRSPL